MKPRPYVLRRDGTLEDRKSGTVIGRVWLGNDGYGWRSENPSTRFGPYATRRVAAHMAWDTWHNPPP